MNYRDVFVDELAKMAGPEMGGKGPKLPLLAKSFIRAVRGLAARYIKQQTKKLAMDAPISLEQDSKKKRSRRKT
jgi:hypothetical protein